MNPGIPCWRHLPRTARGAASTPLVVSWAALLVSVVTMGGLIAVQTGWLPLPAVPAVPRLYSPIGIQPVVNTPATAQPLRTTNPSTVAGFSTLIADVAEHLAPSVVNIDVKSQPRQGRQSRQRSAAVPRPQEGPEFPGGDLFRYFFGLPDGVEGDEFAPRAFVFPDPRQMPRMGNGSGVIFDKDGHILTNNHVIARASEIIVTLSNGKKYPAKVVGADSLTDLAVLKIEAPGLIPAPLGDSNALRPGEWVIAVGSPLGFDHTVTLGIVSAKSRQVPDINSNVSFIQTDAAINPGNSGGPLVNLSGQVIGINTAIAGHGQNIGFAIPSQTVLEIANELVKDGRIQRPMVGLTMSGLNPELAKGLGLSQKDTGVIVAGVLPDSPASEAGFERGDVIQRVDGRKITDPQQVQDLIRNKPIGTTLNVQILREGELKGLKVTTRALDDQKIQDWQQQ